LPSCLASLKELVKNSIDKKNSQEIMHDFVKKNAARQILHFYRRKKQIRISLTSSFDPIDKKQEREEGVRKEFASLIENLKHKYQKANQPVS
jgi:hypothetical protein